MNAVNRIFCAFPVFAPTEKMYLKNMESIISFVNYVKNNSHYLDGSKGHILDVYYGGWSVSDKYWDNISFFIKANIPSAKVFRFEKNYGKAKVVNDLVSDYVIDKPDTQFMFTMDSDIQFTLDQKHFFDRLILAAQVLQDVSKKPFGMISLDQKGECCHWYEPRTGYTGMNQKINYKLNGIGEEIQEEMVWPSDGCGIAGGALFVNLIIWKLIGGYRSFNTEYAGDDGFYLRDVQQAGNAVSILKTLSIIHPIPEDDPQYRKWKDDCMKVAFEPFDQNKYNNNINTDKKWINK